MAWIRDRNSSFDVWVCDTEDDVPVDDCTCRTFEVIRLNDGTVHLSCTDCEVGRSISLLTAPEKAT